MPRWTGMWTRLLNDRSACPADGNRARSLLETAERRRGQARSPTTWDAQAQPRAARRARSGRDRSRRPRLLCGCGNPVDGEADVEERA